MKASYVHIIVYCTVVLLLIIPVCYILPWFSMFSLCIHILVIISNVVDVSCYKFMLLSNTGDNMYNYCYIVFVYTIKHRKCWYVFAYLHKTCIHIHIYVDTNNAYIHTHNFTYTQVLW